MTWRMIGVGFVVGMALRTIDNEGGASPSVLSASDNFHVVRVDTATVPAKVVNLHPFRDRADSKFPDNAVNQAWYLTHTYPSVAVPTLAARPFPTAVKVAEVSLGD